ncbi:hypothetical protein VP01_2692g1 [Puccinia sorghi]|uniref:Uncharacterized protein n=1 Tax=Puccinia sorghi TaxID=27349 RepID=A0A0L6V3Q6_9BASI|nr:hypothetical protein VP01_2692g1 [Puccinia sorghi]
MSTASSPSFLGNKICIHQSPPQKFHQSCKSDKSKLLINTHTYLYIYLVTKKNIPKGLKHSSRGKSNTCVKNLLIFFLSPMKKKNLLLIKIRLARQSDDSVYDTINSLSHFLSLERPYPKSSRVILINTSTSRLFFSLICSWNNKTTLNTLEECSVTSKSWLKLIFQFFWIYRIWTIQSDRGESVMHKIRLSFESQILTQKHLSKHQKFNLKSQNSANLNIRILQKRKGANIYPKITFTKKEIQGMANIFSQKFLESSGFISHTSSLVLSKLVNTPNFKNVSDHKENDVIHDQELMFSLEMIINHISYVPRFMTLIFFFYVMITFRMWIKALLVSLHQFLNPTSTGSINPDYPNHRSLKKPTQLSQTIKCCFSEWLSTTLMVQVMILLQWESCKKNLGLCESVAVEEGGGSEMGMSYWIRAKCGKECEGCGKECEGCRKECEGLIVLIDL